MWFLIFSNNIFDSLALHDLYTCFNCFLQDFQTRLTEAQASEEIMLSLGRSVIGEHFTNPHSDTISEKLTRFIQEWSNLSLAWQNWYDELYASGMHSQSLSENLDKFKAVLKIVNGLSTEMLPASLAMVSADVELRNVEVSYFMYVLML